MYRYDQQHHCQLIQIFLMILFHCQLEISSYFLLDDISRVDRCAGDLFLLFESNGTSVAEAGLNIIEILKIQS